MHHEIEIKISSTLVQIIVIFFNETNEQQRYFNDLKKVMNNSNSLSKFYWLSSSAL